MTVILLKFRRVTIQGARPSARLSEEICLAEGSQGPLRVSSRVLRGLCGASPWYPSWSVVPYPCDSGELSDIQMNATCAIRTTAFRSNSEPRLKSLQLLVFRVSQKEVGKRSLITFSFSVTFWLPFLTFSVTFFRHFLPIPFCLPPFAAR